MSVTLQEFRDALELFERAACWDMSVNEPEYSFVIGLTKYWTEHGTAMDTFFLRRLSVIWTKGLKIRMRSYPIRGISVNLAESADEYRDSWSKMYTDFPFLLNIIANKKWVLETWADNVVA